VVKHFFLTILFFIGVLYVRGQAIGEKNGQIENKRPDTITSFVFIDKVLSVSDFENANPTSNNSFNTKFFKLKWMPVKTSNIDDFVNRSIRGAKVLDTLACKILGNDYHAIIIIHKRKLLILFYLKRIGIQLVFVSEIKNEKRFKPRLHI